MVRWMDRAAVSRIAEDGGFDFRVVAGGSIATIPVWPEGLDDTPGLRGLREATAYLAREADGMGLTEVAALLGEAVRRIPLG